MKVTFALRFVKVVAFLLFKDSPGNNEMTTAIIHHEENEPTTTPSSTTTTGPRTYLVKNVRITEGDDVTLNCTTEINIHEWSRKKGDPDVSGSRTLGTGHPGTITSATVKDSGTYLCTKGKERYIFNVSVKVLVKVEMVISVLSYTFTPELQNKSSEVYKETEKNFTAEMDKVYNNTPGYVRTEVLNFTKGSVNVDFRVIIVFVATDPKNESTITDQKATTGQTIIKEAENGLVSRLRVKPEVIVKTPPPEPREVGFFGVKSDEISTQWMVPEGFKSFDIRSYEVEHWIFGEKERLKNKIPAPEGKTEYTHRIQNLEPETTYMIRVAAINVHGHNYNEEKGQKTLDKPPPPWLIALIVLVVLFTIAAIIGAIVFIRRRVVQRRNQRYEEDALAAMDSPNKFESILHQEKNVKGLNFVFKNASYQPTDVNWTEIPFENIKMMDELGSGAFGVVYKGEISEENGDVTPCAVKALKASATDEEIRDLYNELEIMSNVGSHPNLVNLLGACTKDGNLLVVLEIAENGSLIEFLKKMRSKNENYEGEGTAVGGGLSTDMKLSIAVDVAKGMAHLASHRCIHRDLAARNVLLGENYVAKVADYGMARDVYEQLMYKKETQGKLPVKWMAIESLETYVFTVESDVWSYGVLLWEMETGGLKPYPGLTATELMSELRKGYRLEKPRGCSEAMYQVMMDCWHSNPSLRPTFDQLVERLEQMSVSS